MHLCILGTAQAILRGKKSRGSYEPQLMPIRATHPGPGRLLDHACLCCCLSFSPRKKKEKGTAGYHSPVVVHQKMGRQSAVLVTGDGGGGGVFAARNHTA